MAPKKSPKAISFSLKSIRQTSCMVEETAGIHSEKVDPNLAMELEFRGEEEEVEIIACLSYDYNTEPLVQCKTSSIFHIESLSTYSHSTPEGEHFDIPPRVMVTLLGIAITHGRAYLSMLTARTVYSDLIFPLVDPGSVFHNLLGTDDEEEK